MELTFFMISLAILLYLILPTGLLSIVEYLLAKMESPWPGRILPILSALNSICVFVFLLLNLVYVVSVPAIPLAALAALVLLNIPTAVFLAVYRCTRKKYVEKKGMDKMNIQDL